jgi:hypothetical protein
MLGCELAAMLCPNHIVKCNTILLKDWAMANLFTPSNIAETPVNYYYFCANQCKDYRNNND